MDRVLRGAPAPKLAECTVRNHYDSYYLSRNHLQTLSWFPWSGQMQPMCIRYPSMTLGLSGLMLRATVDTH